MKHVKKIIVMTLLLTIAVLVVELLPKDGETFVTRNTYGEGSKTQEYELIIKDEDEKQKLQLEVEERRYTKEEVQQLFQKVMDELDNVVLGENKSFNRIESDLKLVTALGDYPVNIQWDLDTYEVMSIEGELRQDRLTTEGTLVRLRGTISYVRNMMVFAPTREGTEQFLYEVKQEVEEREASTREEEGFRLPQKLKGKQLTWKVKKEYRWYYILLIGSVSAVYLVYRDREKVKQKEKRRREELIREYPGMISKFTMLLDTGTTVKNAWEKIVQNYELQREETGKQTVYEEMLLTYREMQGGVSEGEAYEKFGKRCGVTVYLKFGAMLAQNLRKGSKGISGLLRMEAIQSFENRKSAAKRLGEEAGTKLLMPMMGMLMVVLVIVMVPAFLTMQL